MIEVTSQASKFNGTQIETVFSDGSKMVQYSDAKWPTHYRSAPNKGMSRALYPSSSPKKCALMDKLAKEGIR